MNSASTLSLSVAYSPRCRWRAIRVSRNERIWQQWIWVARSWSTSARFFARCTQAAGLTVHSSRRRFAARLNSGVRRQGDIMTVKRMDNVGIVVEDLDAAVEFFTELGLTLEGRMPIEGEWAGRVTGVRDQRVEIAMMRTPDGHSRLELSRFD